MAGTAQTVSASTRLSFVLQDYLELFKVRVTALVVATAWCGSFFAQGRGTQSCLSLVVINAMQGIALVAAGSAALNEALEHNLDKKMRRTCMRPLATGSIRLRHAVALAVAMIAGGAILLTFACNWLCAALTLLTSALYLGIYTPMKTVGPACTAVGAIPGAMPPVLGWVAVRGQVDWPAAILFTILLLWQFPHFHAIGILYREDYANAGIKMLPVVDETGRATPRAIVAYTITLVVASVIPTLLGMAGTLYVIVALILGTFLLACGWRLFSLPPWRHAQIKQRSRQLLRATVCYLPLLFLAMIVNRL